MNMTGREQPEEWQRIERSIQKRFRKELWTPFITAVKRYELIQAGDRIAVCISGGKDSMLLAKLTQMLQRISDVPVELVFLAMDPGYSEQNLVRIQENARRLNIPLTMFHNRLFEIADKNAEQSPCYLCARMRRGALYAKAQALGCNKIALGHHMNDVIETTVMAMFYASQLQGMMPKLRSQNFEGMELIRPLYRVREEDILAWKRYNELTFLACACKFTESVSRSANGIGESKRKEIKELIRTLRQTNPDIEKSLFNCIHAVSIDTFPGYKIGTEAHSFLENYGQKRPNPDGRQAETPPAPGSCQKTEILIEDVEEHVAGTDGKQRVGPADGHIIKEIRGSGQD